MKEKLPKDKFQELSVKISEPVFNKLKSNLLNEIKKAEKHYEIDTNMSIDLILNSLVLLQANVLHILKMISDQTENGDVLFKKIVKFFLEDFIEMTKELTDAPR